MTIDVAALQLWWIIFWLQYFFGVMYLRTIASLVNSVLVAIFLWCIFGALHLWCYVHVWCCVFGAMHCQLYRAACYHSGVSTLSLLYTDWSQFCSLFMGIWRDRLHDQPPRVLHRLQVEERGRFGRGRGGADGKLMICYQGKVKNRERENKWNLFTFILFSI